MRVGAAPVTSAVGEAPPEALYRKLKPGPGRSADEVFANQSARLCGAMVELVAECGYERVTVRGLARLAGVSTKTFYKCFTNIEECFSVTYSRAVRDTLRRASEAPRDGEDALRARTRATFEALAQDRKAAQLVLVDFYSAGPAATERARVASRTFERLIRKDFEAPPQPVRVSPSVVQGLFGAALRVARKRLLGQTEADPAQVAARFADWLLVVRDQRLARLCCKAASEELRNFRLPRPDPAIGDERQFLLTAVATLSLASGYRNLSVTEIRREAGVTRRSFDANFADVTDCFLAAVESRLEELANMAEREARSPDGWEREAVRMIAYICSELSRDSKLARFGFIDISAPGRHGLDLRESLIDRRAARLLALVAENERYGELEAEASIAAAWSMIRAEAAVGRHARIGSLAPPIAFVVLAPAIGPAAAEAAIAAELWPGFLAPGSQKTSASAFLTAH